MQPVDPTPTTPRLCFYHYKLCSKLNLGGQKSNSQIKFYDSILPTTMMALTYCLWSRYVLPLINPFGILTPHSADIKTLPRIQSSAQILFLVTYFLTGEGRPHFFSFAQRLKTLLRKSSSFLYLRY